MILLEWRCILRSRLLHNIELLQSIMNNISSKAMLPLKKIHRSTLQFRNKRTMYIQKHGVYLFAQSSVRLLSVYSTDLKSSNLIRYAEKLSNRI